MEFRQDKLGDAIDPYNDFIRAHRGPNHRFDAHCKCTVCGVEEHDDEFLGFGGSGAAYRCRRCGRERDEYERRVPD